MRQSVERDGARVVVIDSLNGYLNAMPDEQFLTAQLHELLAYLGRQGVATLMVVAQQGVVGMNMTSPVDTSYLADSVILFRYFEYAGKVKKAISVMKKRSGAHEESIRELRFDGRRHPPERTAHAVPGHPDGRAHWNSKNRRERSKPAVAQHGGKSIQRTRTARALARADAAGCRGDALAPDQGRVGVRGVRRSGRVAKREWRRGRGRF